MLVRVFLAELDWGELGSFLQRIESASAVKRNVSVAFRTNDTVDDFFDVTYNGGHISTTMLHVGAFDAVQELSKMTASIVRILVLLVDEMLTTCLNNWSFVLVGLFDAEPIASQHVESGSNFVFEYSEVSFVLDRLSLRNTEHIHKIVIVHARIVVRGSTRARDERIHPCFQVVPSGDVVSIKIGTERLDVNGVVVWE